MTARRGGIPGCLPVCDAMSDTVISSNNGRVELQPPKRSESLRSSVWLVALNQDREGFQCIGVSDSPYERHVVVIRPVHPKGLLRFVRGGKKFSPVNDVNH